MLEATRLAASSQILIAKDSQALVLRFTGCSAASSANSPVRTHRVKKKKADTTQNKINSQRDYRSQIEYRKTVQFMMDVDYSVLMHPTGSA